MNDRDAVIAILCGLLSNHSIVNGISDMCTFDDVFDGEMFDEIIVNDAINLMNKVNAEISIDEPMKEPDPKAPPPPPVAPLPPKCDWG